MTNVYSSSEDFSIIIIPDTQYLSLSHPDSFIRMTQWIVDNAKSVNLKMVLHLGDVVHNGDDVEAQFQNAKLALDLIDLAQIPMVIIPGNHDYEDTMRTDRSLTMFNHYFGMNRLQNKAWFGGLFEEGKTENSFALLQINGRNFIFLGLEFGPRDEVLDWANTLLDKYEDHQAIIITHCYMYMNGERNKPGDDHNPKIYRGADGANDGEDMWQKCFKKHRNIASIYSGHQIFQNVSYRMDIGDHQNPVFQSFQNWQAADQGGEGRIRILTYRPSENLIHLCVFNPQSGLFESNNGYEISYPLNADEAWLESCSAIKHP